mgnify:CR=1 FL=1
MVREIEEVRERGLGLRGFGSLEGACAGGGGDTTYRESGMLSGLVEGAKFWAAPFAGAADVAGT